MSPRQPQLSKRLLIPEDISNTNHFTTLDYQTQEVKNVSIVFSDVNTTYASILGLKNIILHQSLTNPSIFVEVQCVLRNETL